MFYSTNIEAARAHFDAMGGWLLHEGKGYLATHDEELVRDLRGQTFLDECERREIWDETLL